MGTPCVCPLCCLRVSHASEGSCTVLLWTPTCHLPGSLAAPEHAVVVRFDPKIGTGPEVIQWCTGHRAHTPTSDGALESRHTHHSGTPNISPQLQSIPEIHLAEPKIPAATSLAQLGLWWGNARNFCRTKSGAGADTITSYNISQRVLTLTASRLLHNIERL